MCDKQQEPCKICTTILRVIFIKSSVYYACQVNMANIYLLVCCSLYITVSVNQSVYQSVYRSFFPSVCLWVNQLISQLVSSYFHSPTLHPSFSPSVLQFLLSMSHPQWFLSVSPSTHKTFIKQINPSYIHGHSLVIGSVSRLTVLSELFSFCLGTQDDFLGIP